MKKQTIDWEELYRRIEVSRAALEGKLTPGAEAQRQLLKQRAIELAREIGQVQQREGGLEIVEFFLGEERYGIESTCVREVLPLKDLTPLPGTPAFIVGIVNVRGQIVALVDLKKLFELPEKGLTELNKIVIVKKGDVEFGILADAVRGTRSVAVQELQPTLPTLTAIRQDYLRGITPDRLVVLDSDFLLTDPRLTVHEGIKNSPPLMNAKDKL